MSGSTTGDERPPIRVMVADDQWMIREGLASLATIDGDIEVVAVAGDGAEAIELAERHRPEVVLMDIRMPVVDGIAATEAILAGDPGAKVLMLTTFDDHQLIERSLAVGAVGYLTKDIAATDLAQSIRSAAAGVVQLSPDVTRILLDTSRDRATAPDPVGVPPEPTVSPAPDPGPLDELTAREREVLVLVARGLSNREIGRELHLSAGTVKNHVSTILRRLGISDRTQAAVIAAQHRLI
ncbi:MAG: response regulator transcription factor [Actinomycetota bacterium]